MFRPRHYTLHRHGPFRSAARMTLHTTGGAARVKATRDTLGKTQVHTVQWPSELIPLKLATRSLHIAKSHMENPRAGIVGISGPGYGGAGSARGVTSESFGNYGSLIGRGAADRFGSHGSLWGNGGHHGGHKKPTRKGGHARTRLAALLGSL